jgi:hypothetical protein
VLPRRADLPVAKHALDVSQVAAEARSAAAQGCGARPGAIQLSLKCARGQQTCRNYRNPRNEWPLVLATGPRNR